MCTMLQTMNIFIKRLHQFTKFKKGIEIRRSLGKDTRTLPNVVQLLA